MYPNQPDPNQNPPQGGFPPATPAPQGYAPQPQYQPPQQPAYGQPPAQPTQQQPAWYVPPQTKAPEGPASASDYVNRAREQQQQATPQLQNPAGFGQPASPNGQYPIDYLNQMSGGQNTAASFNPKIVIAAIVGFILLALGALVLILNSGDTATGPKPEETLYNTVVMTNVITADAKKKIGNSKLVSINSSLDTTLVNAKSGMLGPLSGSGVDGKKLENTAKKDPSLIGTVKGQQGTMLKLEDARLNATYDRAYIREIDYKIQSIILLIDKTNRLSTNTKLKTYVEKIKPDFEQIKKSLDDYKASPAANL